MLITFRLDEDLLPELDRVAQAQIIPLTRSQAAKFILVQHLERRIIDAAKITRNP